MSNVSLKKCCVCGSEMSNGICSNCGYVNIIFPSVVPNSILKMEAERVEVMKKRLAEETQNKRKIEEEVNQTRQKIDNLSQQLSESQKHIEKLKCENSDLKSSLTQVSSVSQTPLKGVVIIEDIRHSIRTAFPVYEGVNTYGTNSGSENHHQIKFNVRGYTFLPVHFTICSRPKGLTIKAAPGVEFYQNGGATNSEVYARQFDNFMFGDRIKVNISEIA